MRFPEWDEARGSLLAAADQILAHRFDLLGYRQLSFGEPIDWHLDPVHGKRAPLAHWSTISFLDAKIAGDHKVVWELNRQQHLMVLGRAYQVSGRLEYAAEAVRQLSAWMDANPPKQGINWASSLEIAYRSIAWIWTLELLQGSQALTPETVARVTSFLQVSARHLERFRSTWFSPNTHLTGEALGLLYIGTMFPEFRGAAKWKTLGWAILEREIERQILPDGVYFEQASYYHWYSVDIFVHALEMAALGGIVPSTAFRERLSLAAEHLAALMRADGSIPFIGDDDGGRLVTLETRHGADARSAVMGASLAVGRNFSPGAAMRGFRSEEAMWLFGAARAGEPLPAQPESGSRHFAVGGYAIMKSGSGRGELHSVIDCGPHGSLSCGHSHSDALSITLSVGGSAVLVDPATFGYSVAPDDRRQFRHSASHNTITVDGESASEPDGKFRWRTTADARALLWSSGPMLDCLIASHDGFLRLPAKAVHTRFVLFVRSEYWLIWDHVEGAGDHDATAHFHFAPGVQVVQAGRQAAWIDAPCEGGSRRLFFTSAGDATPIEWDEDWVSPAYGVRLAGPRARITSRSARQHDIFTLLCVHEGQELREEPVDRGRKVVVSRPDGEDLFFTNSDAVKPGPADVVERLGDSVFVRRAKAS